MACSHEIPEKSSQLLLPDDCILSHTEHITDDKAETLVIGNFFFSYRAIENLLQNSTLGTAQKCYLAAL